MPNLSRSLKNTSTSARQSEKNLPNISNLMGREKRSVRRERSKQEECGREIGGGGLLGEKKDDETLFAE